jgi:hypothetical protein
MSYPTVNQAIAKLMMEARLKVVDELEAALECEEEEFKAAIKKFRDSLVESEEKMVKDAGKKSKKAAKSASDSDDSKKKRQASCFNLFVKDIMPTIAAENPEMKGKETMAAASAAWKTNPMGAFIKEKFEELKKESGNEEISNIDLYAKAKAAYTAESDVKPAVVSDIKKVKAAKPVKVGKIILESETETTDAENEKSDSENEKPKAKKSTATKK